MGSAVNHRWKRSSVDAILLAAAVCMLITCGTVTFHSIQRIRTNSDLVAQTHAAIGLIDRLESALTDAETGQRDYIITGNRDYLVQFNSAAKSIDVHVQALQAGISDKDQPPREIESLKSLVEQKMDEMRATINFRGERTPEAAENVVRNDTGKRIMGEIREQLASMRTAQDQLAGERAAASDHACFTAMLTALISTVVGLGLVATVFWTLQTSSKETQDGLPELATRLSEVDRRKDEFLATLAHELRNPLAPIKNALQLMGLLKLDPEIDKLRQMMDRQVEQLVRLIDDLLDVSRISRGKIVLRHEAVDLAVVIAAAVESSAAYIAESGQQLIVNSLDGNPIYVSGDPSRLTQVVSNLLNNSAKYSNAGCRIELTTTLEDNVAVIRVRDSGIGIAPELLQSLFQMFAQVDDTLERGSSGLGIGLTLVKTLVELHEGTVVAQSDGVGKGSIFTVRLPAIAPPAVFVALPAAPPAATASRSFRVLVVEDMRALRVIMSRLLTKLGHEVEFAEDGTIALQKLDTFRPEVVFSDIAMPGMTGYELARRIRQRSDCAGVRLVALTGFGQAADRDKALEAGFDEHMIKPVDIELLQSLFSHLTRSGAE